MNRTTHRWRSAVCVVGVTLALALPVSDALALAVGRVTVLSTLGQPLRAEVDILNIDAEEAASLRAGIAPPDAFRAAGMEYHAILQNLKVAIQKRSDGRTVLVLTSDRIVNEPFIDLILETSWATGRILRGYTLLFDPPKMQAAEATSPAVAQSAPAPAPPVVAAPVAPPPAAAEPSGAAPRSASAVPSGQRVVKPGDTAGRIAGDTKPPSVSLDQMLVALLRANPQAFKGGNVNRLRAGTLLTIPGAEQASALPPGEATQMLVAQSRDYADFRKRLAEGAPTTPVAAADRKSGGQVQTKVEDKKASPAAPDVLTLSKGSTQAKAAADQAAKSQQTKEAATRVAELSKNLEELNKVKSGLAAASAASGSAAPAPVSTITPASAPGVTVSAVAAPASQVATPTAAPKAQPTISAAAPAAAVQAQNPETARTPEPGLIDQLTGNPLIGGGAALLIALLGAGGFYVWRRRGRTDGGPTALENSLQPESFFKSVQAPAEAAVPVAGSSMIYSPSQLDSAGDVDPVAEADVYLAYGRDIQAEEILREALRVTPTRIAIHAKLLEIYAKRRDAKAFETLAREAMDLCQGQGTEWNAICRLGRELDSANPLYYAAGTAPSPPAAVAPTGASPSAPRASEAGMDTTKMPAVTSQSFAPAPAGLTTPTHAASADLNVDFDLQQLTGVLASSPSPAPAPAPTPASSAGVAPKAPAPDDMMLSFDLDLPAAPVAAAPAAGAPAPAPAPAPVPAPAAGAGMIEFDMGGLSLDLDKPGPVKATDEALDENDPLAMKLALAEEFQAIGDDDGARHLIEEVLAQASGNLKARAQKVLSKLG